MKNASLLLFETQGKLVTVRIRLTIIVVSLIEEIVLLTKVVLERQLIMLKYDGMNKKTKIANLNELNI